MTNRVEASSSSTTSELREIGRLKNLMSLTVVLGNFVEHDGTSWHVDANGKCLCGEHHFHKTLCEALFNRFLKARYKAGMMHTDTSLQLSQKTRVVQCGQIVIGKRFYVTFQNASDDLSILCCGERNAQLQARVCRFIALIAAEDEIDRREKII